MTALASGDNDVALPAVAGARRSRRHGARGSGVQDNAVERARLEAEALANRAQPRRERERAAAERAKAAEEQAEVVRRLGDGLKDLAGGDLMVRLGEGFSPTYAQIRDDFNEAIDKLKSTMLSVVASADAIRTGRAGDLHRLRRSVAPHRAAGGEPGGDRRGARRNHRDGEEVRRGRQPRAASGRPPPTTTPRRAPSSCARRSRR